MRYFFFTWILVVIVVVAIAILLPGDANILLLSGCSLLFGACVMPTYGIVVAHVNDTVPSGDYVAAAGGLLVLQGIGSTIGPIASGAAMSAAGTLGPRARDGSGAGARSGLGSLSDGAEADADRFRQGRVRHPARTTGWDCIATCF